MKPLTIATERLELIAATEELVQNEIGDRAGFASQLSARVPNTWPPEFNDMNTMTFTLQQLEGKPEMVGWWNWYFVLKSDDGETRTLIGNGGFKGRPDGGANVEVGYSILEEFQKHGYGTEAVAGLIDWAFKQGVKSVTAETLPELTASIRVLEKNGFDFQGEGSEEGVILYQLHRTGHS